MSSISPYLLTYSKGTSQTSRMVKMLQSDAIQVDDRSLNDLLAFVVEFSSLIRFFNKNNEADGFWDEIFKKDISIILSIILSTNLVDIEYENNQLASEYRKAKNEGEKIKGLISQHDQIFQLAQRINDWYINLNSITLTNGELEEAIETELYTIIRVNLLKEWANLQQIGSILRAVAPVEADFNPDYESLNDVWNIDDEFDLDEFPIQNDLDAIFIQMRLIYRAFHDNMGFIIFSSKKYFTRSIEDKSDHQPDVGLLIAFLKLYRHTQDSINDIPGKILSFYYDKILHQKKLDSISDKVHLYFELADNVGEHTIPEGTRLIANRDEEGQAVLFETTRELNANRGIITDLKSALFYKDSRETITDFEIVSQLYTAPVANSQDGVGMEFDQVHTPWPTFGESQFAKQEDDRNMVYGEIGFSVASPVFHMREGNRSIQLYFEFDANSTTIFESLVDDVKEKRFLKSDREAFNTIFNTTGKERNISVYLTGARGWVEIDPQNIQITLPEQKGGIRFKDLQIEFSLPNNFPAIVGFNRETFPDERYNTQHPILKILLNHDREPFLYSFIRSLTIANLRIAVEVEGMKRFQLYNDIGEVDSTQPFNPFGPIPKVGSYLLVGSPEIFRKPIDALNLKFDWHDLQPSVEEFNDYYKDYKVKATDYKVKFSALVRNEFIPEDAESDVTYPLFTLPHEQEKNVLKREIRSTFLLQDAALEKMKIIPDPYLPSLNEYQNETNTGYIKMELLEPDVAFGHNEYQRVITQAMSKNAKIIAESTNKDEGLSENSISIPNEPKAPLLRSLSLSYKSSLNVNVAKNFYRHDQQIYHVHPYGVERVFPNRARSEQQVTLLPDYAEDGYLFVGLEQIKPNQIISIFFQLVSVTTIESFNKQAPEVSWSYLSRNNLWKTVDREHFLQDTTDGFTTSGIVEIRLPADISMRSTVLAPEKYWLRASVRGSVEMLCHTLSVHTQAVQAHWVNDGQSERLRRALAPFSIDTLETNIPEVRLVNQPYESAGGKARENDQEYFARISERLKHKNRAVTHSDFEKIILNAFHDLFQVKSMSNLSHPDFPALEQSESDDNTNAIKSGISKDDGIVIVVVPKKSEYLEDLTPSVNYRQLNRIKSYISDFSSPFTSISVRNPSYEYIRVFCKIKFTDNSKIGQFIKAFRQDVKRYICPWYFDKTEALPIGGSIFLDGLKNHIASLPYIKFITAFSILHIIEESDGNFSLEDTADSQEDIKVIYASKPWAVLIPDDFHKIEIIEGEEIEQDAEKVTPPVPFRNRYNIFSRSKFIKIKPLIKKAEDKEDDTDDKTFHTLNIKI